ncbi:MAG: cyanophycinase [Reyranellaceae bacterium]
MSAFGHLDRRRLLGLAIVLPAARPGAASEPRSSGPSRGTLLVIGGGANSPAVISAARRHAGGAEARWVVIPSAQSDDELQSPRVPDFIRAQGRFTLLHTRDRAVANSDAFVSPLTGATAVWFDGGRQWRLAETYGNTRTEQALWSLLDRGGLIAGSSAGATIQGSFLVRGAPSGNKIMVDPNHQRGLGFLRNVAIDQHIVARHRESDLAQVIRRHPGLLGIGIDEGTAILVQGSQFTVIGPSVVAITDGAMHDGKPYYLLREGARFDLATWTVLAR